MSCGTLRERAGVRAGKRRELTQGVPSAPPSKENHHQTSTMTLRSQPPPHRSGVRLKFAMKSLPLRSFTFTKPVSSKTRCSPSISVATRICGEVRVCRGGIE